MAVRYAALARPYMGGYSPTTVMILLFALFVNTAAAHDISRLDTLRRAYPTVTFSSKYDDEKHDYLITISRGGSSAKLYWADGKMLDDAELPHAADYWAILYHYPAEIPDPAHFTTEYVEYVRERTSAASRKAQAGSSQSFFDAIYDSPTRQKTEEHIRRVTFLGKSVSVHEWITGALQQVEKDIRRQALQDTEVRDFVNSVARVEGYNWREITDRSSRSFHSYGIAVDILPKNWGQKNIYWGWRRDKDPDNWMLLPLDQRWMPPTSVIRIFERHGFIWGGKWMVWDNMHFEYHPEIAGGK